MSLQEQLEELRTKIEAKVPQPALEIMHKATVDLIATGIEGRILSVGSVFPNFNLPDHEDNHVDSTELFAEGPTIITFYRGVWCPYCNIDLAYMGSQQAAIEAVGGQLIAISPQLGRYSQQIRSKNNLAFPILSDAGNELAKQLGLRFHMSEDLLSLYRDSFRIDLPTFHGDDSWTLPMPARYVVDQTGIIQYAEASADYTKRPDPEALLDEVKKLTNS